MSPTTAVVDEALIYIIAFSFLLFFLIIFFMILFVVRYRKERNPVPVDVKGGGWLEVIWITASLFLVITMFIYGLTGFTFLRNTPSDSIKVKVHSRQWSWLFEYANGKKSPNLVVPEGKNISCDLTSADVIHGFYIPSFRIQMDAVPGMTTHVWFKATTTGSYDILCAQYCGLKHSLMRAKVHVVEPDIFTSWLKGENIEYPEEIRTPDMQAGELLLSERGCISCHSLVGGTLVGPTLEGLYGSTVRVRTKGKLRTLTADDAYIRRSILDPGADIVDGFRNIMLSGRDILTDKEIDEIIAYLKDLK